MHLSCLFYINYRKQLILWPKPQRKTRQRIMRRPYGCINTLLNISYMRSNVITKEAHIASQTMVPATIECGFHSKFFTVQMRPTATRQRKVYEESACSTWTGRRSSKTTWKIKTSKGKSQLRSHRAMTSELSLHFSKEGVFLYLEITVTMATSLCFLPAGVTVIVRGKIQRRKNCRSNLWVRELWLFSCTDYCA